MLLNIERISFGETNVIMIDLCVQDIYDWFGQLLVSM